jgi:AmmeMemoRadiSam system protein B
MWFLRDPMQLSPYQIFMPPALAQMLLFCDGTRTPRQIHAAFCQHVGEQVDFDLIADTLQQLDTACLLNNETSRLALAKVEQEFRAQSHRPPALADLSYPADAAELTRLFDSYAAEDHLNGWQGWQGRAIVSPHIDYQRGGEVYAKVWRRAQTAVLDADLVIILGTDHNGGFGTFTLTRLPYATPYGVIPTDVDLVDKLAKAISPEEAYKEEIHHRNEHSVELSAVWLHYICHKAGQEPPPMVPILIGSFHRFVVNGEHPSLDELLMTAVDTLKHQTAGKKVLIVASVDLSHVGPAFSDDFVMDEGRREQLREEDGRLMEAVLTGDHASFYDQIASIEDRNHVCGFAPIYLMLRYLDSVENSLKVDYLHCPADAQDDSLVSICGLLLE